MAAVPSVPFPFKGSDTNTYSGNTVPIDAAGAVPGSAADGAHVSIGAKADAAPASPAATGSVVGVLKGIWTALLARLPLDTNGNLKQALYDSTGAVVTFGGTTPVQGVANGVAVAVDTIVRMTATDRGGLTAVRAVSAIPAAGGSNYAANDTITNAAGTFTINTVNAGAVLTVTPLAPTPLTAAPPANPLAQTATSGTGTGATLTVTYAPVAVQVAAANTARRGYAFQNQSDDSLWLGTTTATADYHSKIYRPGDDYESLPHHSGTGIISVIGTKAGQPFYAREF